jgi:membrane protein required for colicin V production
VTALDAIVFVIAVLSAAAGWRRGFLRAAISIVAAFLGLVLAANCYGPVGAMLAVLTTTQRSADLLGFGLIFTATLAAGAYGGHRLRKALDRARLSWVDRSLGLALGLVRAWLVCSALYLGLTAFPVRIEAVERSRSAPILVEGTRALAYLGSSELRRQYSEGYDALLRLWSQSEGREAR